MTLKSFLTRLILLCVLPLLLLASYLAFDNIRTNQAESDREAANLANSFATAIDRRLTARIRGLNMLALSPLVDDASRWRELYEQAQSFRETFDSHIIFADREMRMLFNTRVPFGTALPVLPRPKGHAAAPAAVETGKPAVGDTFIGPIAKELLVAVAVPVLREGKTAFLFLTVFETRQFRQQIEQVTLPTEWSLILLDGRGEAIARRAPPRLDPATDVDPAGRFVAKSTVSPWSVVLEIPRGADRAPMVRAAVAFAVTILAITLISALGGMLASRRLARSVASLAHTPARGGVPGDIAEIAAVRSALDQAAREHAGAEAARRESEDRYRDLVEHSQELICTHDLEGKLLSVNLAVYRILGSEPGSLVGTNLRDLLSPKTRDQFPAYLAEIQAKGSADGVMAVQAVGGELRYWEYHNTLRKEDVSFPFVRGMGRDITEKIVAKRALKESEQRSRAAFEQAAVGIALVSPEGRWLQVNHRLCEIVGYGQEELLARTFQSITHPEDLDADLASVGQMLAGEIASYTMEKRYLRKGGAIAWVNLTVSLVRRPDGSPDYFISVVEDIQRRKDAELALRAAEEQFHGLVDQSITGIYIIQDGKFAYVNPRYVQIFGYDSADELLGREAVSLVAEKDRDRIAKQMRQRLEGEAVSPNYEFGALRKDGSVIDVGVHGTRATHAGRPAIIGLLQDISEKKRAEEQIRTYLAQLETAFMSTVEVATTLSEMRDPYTAGHERRVAEIAVAIGAQLGLVPRQIEGLRVAGHLHDVGKITVPAEILAKPGKLTSIEFELIKGHAQASYDVLKDVKFPWPVAQVALQHHERVDGSGYPQGLKGESIILEARIMAVADVIEAMSTHRPYRPGLGIDKALAEIERGRGSAYDAEVADAALRLFREAHYQLPA